MDNDNLPDYIVQDSSIIKFKTVRDRILSVDTATVKSDQGIFLKIDEQGKLKTDETAGSKIIITTFKNGYSQLKALNGKIATAREDLGGIIVFEKDSYSIYEEFILKKIENNKYTITTPFKESLVASEKENTFHTTRHANEELIVELIK